MIGTKKTLMFHRGRVRDGVRNSSSSKSLCPLSLKEKKWMRKLKWQPAMKVKKAVILLMILKILCQRIQIQRYLITQKKTWNQTYSCCSNCRIMMPLPHSFHYTISKGHKNEYFSTKKKKKNLVPKNQNFNTRSYLTSKNSKRSMNTTLLYNNNLNDENSKPKQKQSGSSSASSSSCTTSTSLIASSTIGHF